MALGVRSHRMACPDSLIAAHCRNEIGIPFPCRARPEIDELSSTIAIEHDPIGRSLQPGVQSRVVAYPSITNLLRDRRLTTEQSRTGTLNPIKYRRDTLFLDRNMRIAGSRQ